MSAVDVSDDPLLGFRFIVTITGISGNILGFQSVTGLSMECGVLDWIECTDPVTGIKLPKEVSYGDVTLARGVSKNRYIVDWWEMVVKDSKEGSYGSFRKDVSITVYPKGYTSGSTGSRVIKVLNAWPSKLNYSDLEATSSDVFVESLVLSNEGIQTGP